MYGHQVLLNSWGLIGPQSCPDVKARMAVC